MIDECKGKNSELASNKNEKSSLEEQIKRLRIKIASDKKKAPRKRKGQVVEESESEVDLKDFLHRKKLIQDRLKVLQMKPKQQLELEHDNNDEMEDDDGSELL